ncbi:hypothetical protein BJ875DRAFT_526986 [Amylocarpus encephaloides]|uniref:Cation-transporting P-type ATPase N-terminal domain-containing protein n=1 Tax=Amylocarpus encephaloides TaxID=45428 RepID=A0A9P7YSU1_9HELO|nr:hypothetical protein BJ875DRAFT_526986 [Amylocarpus encephaloides]
MFTEKTLYASAKAFLPIFGRKSTETEIAEKYGLFLNVPKNATLQVLASVPTHLLLSSLKSSKEGLRQDEIPGIRKTYGENIPSAQNPPKWWQLEFKALFDYFNALLIIIAVVSVVVGDIWFGHGHCWFVLRYSVPARNEGRGCCHQFARQHFYQCPSSQTPKRYSSTTMVVDSKGLVPGDIVLVGPGDTIACDCVVLESTNLSVGQSSLTGESQPQRKSPDILARNLPTTAFELSNILFMGANVISDTFIASIMNQLNKKRPLNTFQLQIRNITYLIIAIIITVFPIVNGFLLYCSPPVSLSVYFLQCFQLGEKISEISFNFGTLLSSCILRTDSNDGLLICNEVSSLDDNHRRHLTNKAAAFNADGYRAVLVATRKISSSDLHRNNFDGSDVDLTIEGLLAFLDPPKDDAKSSIARLHEQGVDVRCLTGDNLGLALKVCRDLEIVQQLDEEHLQAISGPELERIEGTDEIHGVVKHCKIFAKLTPNQKGQVIQSLKKQHGEMNISRVDTGQNAAKDCADTILAKKDISTIVDCVNTGRVTQGNTLKCLKMVLASNFGNILSVLIASAWLLFQRMTGL